MKSKAIKTVGELKKWLDKLDDETTLYRVQNLVFVGGEKRWQIVEGVTFDQKRVATNDGMTTVVERAQKKYKNAKLGVII